MKILIADDEIVSRTLLERNLRKWGYEVVSVTDGKEAFRILTSADAPSIAIMDWSMPAMDGLELCKQIRAIKEPYIYVIFLTAQADRESFTIGMEAGADDFLVKPFDPYDLKIRTEVGVRIVTMQQELIAARESLREAALRDSLTKLYNRAAIFDLFQKEWNRAQREEAPLCLIMGDLDYFKQVNDTYGHLIGDLVLKQASTRFTTSIRVYDSVGRYGGEEFLFIIPGIDCEGGYHIAERIRKAISDVPFHLPECEIPVTMSLGVASNLHLSADNPERLIAMADEALYAAKRNGRNRVVRAELQTC